MHNNIVLIKTKPILLSTMETVIVLTEMGQKAVSRTADGRQVIIKLYIT